MIKTGRWWVDIINRWKRIEDRQWIIYMIEDGSIDTKMDSLWFMNRQISDRYNRYKWYQAQVSERHKQADHFPVLGIELRAFHSTIEPHPQPQLILLYYFIWEWVEPHLPVLRSYFCLCSGVTPGSAWKTANNTGESYQGELCD